MRASFFTSALMVSRSEECSDLRVSISLDSWHNLAMVVIQSAILDISSCSIPRVVMAGVPRRTPFGLKAPPVSPGRALAFRVRPTWSRACS